MGLGVQLFQTDKRAEAAVKELSVSIPLSRAGTIRMGRQIRLFRLLVPGRSHTPGNQPGRIRSILLVIAAPDLGHLLAPFIAPVNRGHDDLSRLVLPIMPVLQVSQPAEFRLLLHDHIDSIRQVLGNAKIISRMLWSAIWRQLIRRQRRIVAVVTPACLRIPGDPIDRIQIISEKWL